MSSLMYSFALNQLSLSSIHKTSITYSKFACNMHTILQLTAGAFDL